MADSPATRWYDLTRSLPLLSATMALGVLACTSDVIPTEPVVGEGQVSLAAAPNTWTPKAPPPFAPDFSEYALGTAPNSAGQPVAYTFGGLLVSDDGHGVGGPVQAYNATTNTWSGKVSRINVYHSNGVGWIGNKLYISGGITQPGTLQTFTNSVLAYDYTNDRLINRANLPIVSAEGVTGVIGGKLYVLPGACSGDGYPQPGYCAEEQTRRFYRYDPITNKWIVRRQAPHFHRRGAAAVINGKFYVAGGFAGFDTPVAALDVYDPATNIWRTLASLPTGGIAEGGMVNGQFYVVVQGPSGNRAYAYNRITNQWKTRAAPEFFGSVTRVTLDGKAYLFTANANQSALYTP